MAIVVNGRKYRRLEEPLYVNGKKVVKAFANKKMVYPDIPPYVAKLRGFSTGPKGRGAFGVNGATIEVVFVITSYAPFILEWQGEAGDYMYNDASAPKGYVVLHQFTTGPQLLVDIPKIRDGFYIHADPKNYIGGPNDYGSPFNPDGYYYTHFYGKPMYEAFMSTVNKLVLGPENWQKYWDDVDRDVSLYRGDMSRWFDPGRDDPRYGELTGSYGFIYEFGLTDPHEGLHRFVNPLTEVLYTNCRLGELADPTEPTPEHALKITEADFKTIKGV